MKRRTGGVVSVDAQLDTGEVQPVVRQVQGRLHQRRPDALALPVVVYSHPDIARMPRARVGRHAQTQLSDHLSPSTQATRWRVPSGISESLLRSFSSDWSGSCSVPATARLPL